tara:strand:- start:481 stop:645 length:165 start_codon:yes stop_codon:yes gene_type:complete
MSKGSTPRAYSIDAETFDENWKRIFGQKPDLEEYTDTDLYTFTLLQPETKGESL